MKSDLRVINKEEKTIIEWIKNNKKKLVVAGVSITTLTLVVLAKKNKIKWEEPCLPIFSENKQTNQSRIEKIHSTIDTLPLQSQSQSTRMPIASNGPFDVKQHIRTMSPNKHHSAEKAAEAKLLGIILEPNQTIVDEYQRYMIAA